MPHVPSALYLDFDNVFTELRKHDPEAALWFAEQPEVFDPRGYLGPARDALREWVAKEMQAFGSAGHAQDYEPVTLEDMKRAYSGQR